MTPRRRSFTKMATMQRGGDEQPPLSNNKVMSRHERRPNQIRFLIVQRLLPLLILTFHLSCRRPSTITIHCLQLRPNPFRHNKRNRHHPSNDAPRLKSPFLLPFSLLPSPRRMLSPWWTSNAAVAGTDTDVILEDDTDNERNNVTATTFDSRSKLDLLEEATNLQAKAAQIRAEILIMEQAIQKTQTKIQTAKLADTDALIQKWFEGIPGLDAPDNRNSDETDDRHEAEFKNETINMGEETVLVTSDMAHKVARRLVDGRSSEAQVLQVVDRLWDLQSSQKPLRTSSIVNNTGIVTSSTNITDAIMSNVPTDEQELLSVVYKRRIAALTQACQLLDEQTVTKTSDSVQGQDRAKDDTTDSDNALPPIPVRQWSGRTETAVRARLKDLQERRTVHMTRKLAAEMNKFVAEESKGRRPVEGLNRNDIPGGMGRLWQSSSYAAGGRTTEKKEGAGSTNGTSTILSSSSSIVPMWVPSSFLPLIINSEVSTVGREEVEAIKTDVLTGSHFFVTSSESVPGAAIFRGNIRPGIWNEQDTSSTKERTTNAIKADSEIVFAEIQERMKAHRLDEKVQLFMLPDPEDKSPTSTIRNSRNLIEIEEAKPVILALSKALSPDESNIKKRVFSSLMRQLSYPFAALSTFMFAMSTYSLNPTFLDRLINRRDLTVLYACIPVALGTMAIQVVHEMVGFLVAKKKKIKIGRPIPIPSFHFTTLPFFGCITSLQSFPTDRGALLDFALSGPLSAIAVSIGLVFAGILLTTQATALDLSRFPFMPVANMKASFLLGSLLSWLAPKTMMLPLAQPIPMHPCFVVGASGLVTNALNLLPIFRLDGGRACFAAMGQRQGAIISVFTLLLILSMSLSGAASIFLTWTLLVVILQHRDEVPVRDDCTEVSGGRLLAWFLSFLLALSILSPFPGYSKLAS